MLNFSNSYIELGEQFFQRIAPEKVASARLLLWNENLATQLSFSSDQQSGSDEEKALLAQYFSGNNTLNGAEPIALAYSGHQFGHFNPQLGDGRAHLLGEVLDNNGIRRDIQLKGSGRTAFSRRGDGKCALAPALREYIMSEAMFALGVPTSRCLAVVSTGELINRGMAKAGAVVTRVASSHIRVGTFQYFAARGDLVSLKSLLDYTIKRHFPEINSLEINAVGFNRSESNNSEKNDLNMNDENSCQEQRILAFLEQAIAKQITLVVAWLRVGFIHGVMNTDNTAISGETIDFGPCAMLGIYDENAVFSSIDEYGRYAFANQSKIAQWNMARLADCLLPLLIAFSNENGSSTEQGSRAVAKVEAVIHQYTDKFSQAYYAMYANKLGLGAANSDNNVLIDDLLAIMQTKGLDYTQTFHRLTQSLTNFVKAEELKIELGEWYETWLCAFKKAKTKANIQHNVKTAQALMSKNNPVVIPRNHHVESILARCEEVIHDDSQQTSASDSVNTIVSEFLTVLQSPYQELDATESFQDTPEDGDQYYQTFCGT